MWLISVCYGLLLSQWLNTPIPNVTVCFSHSDRIHPFRALLSISVTVIEYTHSERYYLFLSQWLNTPCPNVTAYFCHWLNTPSDRIHPFRTLISISVTVIEYTFSERYGLLMSQWLTSPPRHKAYITSSITPRDDLSSAFAVCLRRMQATCCVCTAQSTSIMLRPVSYTHLTLPTSDGV